MTGTWLLLIPAFAAVALATRAGTTQHRHLKHLFIRGAAVCIGLIFLLAWALNLLEYSFL